MKSDLDQETETDTADGPEAKKPSDQILRHEMVEAMHALRRSTSSLVFSGLATGLNIGLSVFVMAVIWTQGRGAVPDPVLKLLMANAYALGFIFVVLGRSELFTEQTTLAVLPVLGGRAPVTALARLWVLVYATNLLGAIASAALVAWLGPALGVVDPRAFGHIAHTVVEHPGWVILASGALAGWLMGLLSWLVAAGRDTISQVVVVWLIAATLGITHVHHSIVGSIEVLAAIFARQPVTAADLGHFLLWATLGNVIGGILFATIVTYGHVGSGEAPPPT